MRWSGFLALRCYDTALLFAALVGPAQARAETLDEIKGVSVIVSWRQAETGYNEFGVRFRLPRDRAIKLYVSSKGNIFEYPAESNNWRYGPAVYAIDKATLTPSGHWGQGQMTVWTMMDGHLTRVTKAIQGFA